MTTFNKSTLKLLFEQGDVPTGQNYSDLIDSQVNLVETTAQSMAGPLITTELITPLVSATNLNITGTVSAGSTVFNSLVVRSNTVLQGSVLVQAQSTYFGGVTFGSAISVTGGLTVDTVAAAGAITAGTMGVIGDVSANAVKLGVGIVSAAGTAQATAALLTSTINRGKGVVDGSTTGYRPPANQPGLVQYLYNEGASANLWPPTGGFINGLAANAPFALATSAMVTIVHLTASAYAVK